MVSLDKFGFVMEGIVLMANLIRVLFVSYLHLKLKRTGRLQIVVY